MAQILNKEVVDSTGQKLYVSGESPEAVNQSITAASLAPVAPITIPQPKPDTTNYQGIVAGGNAIVGANNTTLIPKESGTPSSLDALLASINTPVPSASSIYNTDYAASGIGALQADKNTKAKATLDAQARLSAINAQLADITAEAQAIPIRMESQATGGTMAGLETHTRGALRENALKALYLQAQALAAQAEVATAQGNEALSQSILQQAQSSLDTVYKIHMDDAQAQYTQKTNALQSIYSYLTAQEKTKAEALQKANDQALTLQRHAMNQAQDLAKTAIANGQGALAGQLMALDPKDPAYSTKVAALAGQMAGGGSGVNNAIDFGQPVVAPGDPTKTTAQNNVQTLRQIFQSSKVSTGNKTSVGNALALAQAAQDLADANIDGTFSGFSPFRAVTDIKIPFTNIGLPFRETLKRNKTIQNEAMISALNLQTQFWASGAALTEAQTKLVQKMIPVVTDTDTQIRTKVNQLINYMLSQTASRLVTDGIDFKPAKVDMFETVGLLDKASPEQLAELKAAGLTQ